jgi:hypothetical protein
MFYIGNDLWPTNPALGISTPGRQGRGNHFVRHEQNIGTESPTPEESGSNAQIIIVYKKILLCVFLF